METEQLLNGSKTIREISAMGITKLQAQCHPDKHPCEPDRAAEVFRKMTSVADSVRSPQIVKSPRRDYSALGMFTVGDVADIHFGQNSENGKLTDYIIKIARTEAAHVMLEAEKSALTALHSAAGDKVYRKCYPLIAESFPVRDRIQKRVNVFTHSPGFHPLTWILSRHKRLDGHHIGWLFKRVLMTIGFAHQQKLVHGAVTPDHILVNPSTHGIMLVGWGQSVELGKPIRFMKKGVEAFKYPPEVRAKKPATAGTDIYMAALCMKLCWLRPGQEPIGVPKKLVRFVESCLLEGQNMRSNDALELHDKFSDTLRDEYGPPKFVTLAM
jgi:hypothetical protein